MRLSLTLSFYFGRRFLLSVALVFLAIVATIFIFDMVELLRRGAGPNRGVSFGIMLQMALLRLPYLAHKALPFIALAASILTFMQMTRSRELVVARAAGVSVWQFLLPALFVAALIGCFFVTVVNPFASAMVSRYERMDATYLGGDASLLALSKTGVWLRQNADGGHTVLHGARFDPETFTMHDVIVFRYEEGDRFVGRIDAGEARLEEGYWALKDAAFNVPGEPPDYRATDRMATDFTPARIRDSFSPPETLSFWALPGFIDTLEHSGFSGVKHRLHWHSLLTGPLLICAMVMVAAAFSLRYNRRGPWIPIAGGVLTGFLFYFITDLVLALGLSGDIPPVLAAWTPPAVFALLGIAGLFHFEDG